MLIFEANRISLFDLLPYSLNLRRYYCQPRNSNSYTNSLDLFITSKIFMASFQFRYDLPTQETGVMLSCFVHLAMCQSELCVKSTTPFQANKKIIVIIKLTLEKLLNFKGIFRNFQNTKLFQKRRVQKQSRHLIVFTGVNSILPTSLKETTVNRFLI